MTSKIGKPRDELINSIVTSIVHLQADIEALEGAEKKQTYEISNKRKEVTELFDQLDRLGIRSEDEKANREHRERLQDEHNIKVEMEEAHARRLDRESEARVELLHADLELSRAKLELVRLEMEKLKA